ncbi:hypothetical protein [Pollutimonas subterranea]|nr:hypothetical protein [Pollutimonas subterranea]
MMVVDSAALTVFALWVRDQGERRQEKEAYAAEHDAFRKAFTIHQN